MTSIYHQDPILTHFLPKINPFSKVCSAKVQKSREFSGAFQKKPKNPSKILSSSREK